MLELIGKIVGYVAIISSFVIYQQKSQKGLLICKGISDILWIIHYAFLGAFTGAAVTIVALIRELTFFTVKSENKKRKSTLIIFLIASAVCTAFTWKNFFSIFALMGSLLSVTSFWVGSPKLSRVLSFPISICMLIYGVSNNSNAVLINEIIVITSSLLGILFIDKKKP